MDIDAEDADALLWYVAYGSNVSAARFSRYLERHARHAGVDAIEPAGDCPMRLGHQLFFAHESRVWTGGSAFVEPVVTPGAATLARAWLVRRDQFESVVAQENGRDPLARLLGGEVWSLPPGASRTVAPARYGLVVGTESPDERPAFTFTTPERPLPTPNRPADAYVDTIVEGLMASHGLDEAVARAYVFRHVESDGD